MTRTTDNQQTADQLRAEANAHDDAAAESFERCDTDGFVSQWAHGISGRLKRRQATIAEAGGVAEFPALFTLDGERAPALIVETRYGRKWMVENPETGAAVAWLKPAGAEPTAESIVYIDPSGAELARELKAWKRRVAKLAEAGFVEGVETVPAAAKIDAPKGARGLSGAASCFVRTYRLDGGYPGRKRGR